jgi:hypothetical protein
MILLIFLFNYAGGSIYFSPFYGRVLNKEKLGSYSFLELNNYLSSGPLYLESKIGFGHFYFKDYENFKNLFLLESSSWFSTVYNIKETRNYSLYFFPQELFFDLDFGNFKIKTGRFLLPWEISYFFSHFSFFTPTYRFSPFLLNQGPVDGTGIIYSKGFSKFELYWLPSKGDTTRWGMRMGTTLGSFDFKILTNGDDWGFGSMTNLFRGILRVEIKGGGNDFSYSISYDRSFEGDIYTLFEFTEGYKTPLGSTDVISLKLQKSHDLWDFSLMGYRMTKIKEITLLFNVSYNLRENIDLEFGILYGKNQLFDEENSLFSLSSKFYF